MGVPPGGKKRKMGSLDAKDDGIAAPGDDPRHHKTAEAHFLVNWWMHSQENKKEIVDETSVERIELEGS